jgi:hypothetical protein
MATEGPEGRVDDAHQTHDRNSLKRLHRARGVENDNLEEHEREPRGGKITHTEMHHHAVTRVDAHFDVQVLAATKRDLPKMEYLCFIGMEFGMVEDERGILRWHPGKREPIERDLSFAEVARHYRLSDDTVQQYDKRARRVYGRHLANAEYARGQSGEGAE